MKYLWCVGHLALEEKVVKREPLSGGGNRGSGQGQGDYSHSLGRHSETQTLLLLLQKLLDFGENCLHVFFRVKVSLKGVNSAFRDFLCQSALKSVKFL